MSEHITHLAVAEDSARLVSINPDFNRYMLDSIRRFPSTLQLGSVTRSGDTFILPLLTEWKKNWQKSDPRSEKMAYILGWAGHLAGDRTFKPVFRITDLAFYVRGFPGPAHASIYHDAVTFGKVYHYGESEPFHPAVLQPSLRGHAAADYLPVESLESAFAASFGNQLATLKTFLPADLDNWEEQWSVIEDERQKFYVDIDRYTEAHHHNQPDRMRQYIIEPNFYNDRDPIIRIARSVQAGKTPDVSLEEALQGTENQSLYAQALKLGYDFMMAASDYFSDKIDLKQAKKAFRIGQPHKQKLEYYVKQAQMQNQDQK